MDFKNITRIEYHGQPALSTAQLAEFYECAPSAISNNFKNNESRYVKGKHFFKLKGDELATFKNCEKLAKIFAVLRDNKPYVPASFS
ncbi:MAG: ORF6N domain-containing protein [Selenomonadaceae bacterium]|nr:ORF6N domain-containing protein [Selenomonadaceae bacterium]MBR0102446.1 ORF6N domain-containing protein [Selenomonadaceae bacterium]